MQIENDKVVLFHYDLREVDGDFIESSREGDPIAYLHGKKGIIKGLEEAFFGKEKGESLTVTVQPEKGYGLRVEEAMQRIPMKHLNLKKKEKPTPGLICNVQTEQGIRQVTIVKVGRYSADVDTNHPLAGKILEFSVDIVEVRDASEEELAHGHAHGIGGHKH